MKRTDTVTKIIVCLLFIAVAGYIGVYFYRSASDRMVTAEVTIATVTTGGTAAGIIIREEMVLRSSETYIDITAENGSRVGVGQTVATAMNSEQALQRSEHIHELELEVSRLSSLLGSIDTASDITSRDKSINSLLLSLTSSVSRGELNNLDSVCLNLSSLVFTDSGVGATQAELDQRKSELEALKNSAGAGTRSITTDISGIFSKTLDGYEHLGLDILKNVTPATLNAIIDSQEEPGEDAFGKIATDYSWYFAAIMSSANAAQLEIGSTAELDFGRFYSGTIHAKVQSISAPEAGDCAVVLRCTSALADTLSLRTISAQVAFETFRGIRVPAGAVHLDEEGGGAYVYAVTAMQLERKDVEVIYSDSDYVIVSRSSGPNSLREGNTIVVSGDDLYEGKVLK